MSRVGSFNDQSYNDPELLIVEAPLTFVMDASVCIKWFSSYGEENAGRAMKLREDFLAKKIYLIAPDLIIYEIVNALSYNPNFSMANVIEALGSLNAMHIKTVSPLPGIMDVAVKLKFVKNISCYDSVYLALARFLNIQFITADKNLFDKVKDLGNALFLADYN